MMGLTLKITNDNKVTNYEKRKCNMTLKDLPIGKTATVQSVGGDGALRQHFLDMGLIPQADVTMVECAPMGDPVELRIHISYELTLRLADAQKIIVENVRDAKAAPPNKRERKRFRTPDLGKAESFTAKKKNTPAS